MITIVENGSDFIEVLYFIQKNHNFKLNIMYFILSEANLKLFKLLKSTEFSTPCNPRWEGSERTPTTWHPGKPSVQFLWLDNFEFLISTPGLKSKQIHSTTNRRRYNRCCCNIINTTNYYFCGSPLHKVFVLPMVLFLLYASYL